KEPPKPLTRTPFAGLKPARVVLLPRPLASLSGPSTRSNCASGGCWRAASHYGESDHVGLAAIPNLVGPAWSSTAHDDGRRTCAQLHQGRRVGCGVQHSGRRRRARLARSMAATGSAVIRGEHAAEFGRPYARNVSWRRASQSCRQYAELSAFTHSRLT